MEGIELYGLITAAVGGVCALVSTMLPVPGDTSGTFYKVIYKAVNWAGCNWGKACNTDDTLSKKLKNTLLK